MRRDDMTLKYEIVETIGVLSTGADGAKTKEVNMVAWNDKRPKLDIRGWDRVNNKPLKGITLTWEETQKLLEFIQELGEADFR